MSEFPAKYLKKLPTGFTDNVDSMTTEEVQDKILESEGHIYEVDKSMDEDEKLAQARELVKEMTAPYRDAKTTETAKIKYCLFVLEGRGASVSRTSAAADED